MKMLDEVIKAFECCLNPADKLGNCREECPYIHCCDPTSIPVKMDALHYLKEYQEHMKWHAYEEYCLAEEKKKMR